jgi:hypothetical protein
MTLRPLVNYWQRWRPDPEHINALLIPFGNMFMTWRRTLIQQEWLRKTLFCVTR